MYNSSSYDDELYSLYNTVSKYLLQGYFVRILGDFAHFTGDRFILDANLSKLII